MNIMRKLVFLVAILGLVAFSVGCQSGLSEEEIRSIVREEVTAQLSSLDKLTVSELNIRNGYGKTAVVITATTDGNGMLLINDHNGEGRALLHTDARGDGNLSIVNHYGEVIASLEASKYSEGVLIIGNKEKKRGAYLCDTYEGGLLYLTDSSGNILALLAVGSGQAALILKDIYGRTIFGAP